MSQMTTFAPSLANRVAIPSPIPLAEPVTSATLPSSSTVSHPSVCLHAITFGVPGRSDVSGKRSRLPATVHPRRGVSTMTRDWEASDTAGSVPRALATGPPVLSDTRWGSPGSVSLTLAVQSDAATASATHVRLRGGGAARRWPRGRRPASRVAARSQVKPPPGRTTSLKLGPERRHPRCSRSKRLPALHGRPGDGAAPPRPPPPATTTCPPRRSGRRAPAPRAAAAQNPRTARIGERLGAIQQRRQVGVGGVLDRADGRRQAQRLDRREDRLVQPARRPTSASSRSGCRRGSPRTLAAGWGRPCVAPACPGT